MLKKNVVELNVEVRMARQLYKRWMAVRMECEKSNKKNGVWWYACEQMRILKDDMEQVYNALIEVPNFEGNYYVDMTMLIKGKESVC